MRSAGARNRPALLGRRDELAELRDGLADARSGRGRLFLVAGEGGIGKTRLLEALIGEAEPTEVRACWGRCWEGGGAAPFWPWAQVIRALVSDAPADALARRLGPGASDIAQIVPEAASKLPGLAPAGSPDSPDARLRLFDAVSTFLRNTASEGGLIVALDDLHAADEVSLRLLQHVTESLEDTNLLVVGTYRDAEVRSSPQLYRLLAAIARQGRRIVLAGLDERDVVALIEQTTMENVDATFAREVYHVSDGNPFFVQEVIRLHEARVDAERVPVPEEVHALISRRVAMVPEAVRDTLSLAAVVGREFDLVVLQDSSALPREKLLDALGSGGAMNVVEEVGLGRWSFHHALLREALYEELRPSQRVELHRRVGEALERVHAGDLRPHLAELAHHFFEAARGGDGVKALQYCRLAGDAAMDALAFEEAAVQYARALEALALKPPVNERQRYDLLMGLGQAKLRVRDFPQAREIHRRALKAARALGSAELLAEAAVGFFGEPEATFDESRVSVLEEARAALPDTDSPLRARVLLALASTLKRPPEVMARLADEGLAMARRVGDPATLRQALWEWHHVHIGAEPEARLHVADELIRLATEAGDRERLQEGRQWRSTDLFALGEVEAMRSELAIAAREAEELRLAFLVWGTTFQRAAVALLEGNYEEAERLAREALTAGERSHFADVEAVFTSQLCAIRREQGRFEEMADFARRGVEGGSDHPFSLVWRNWLALAHAELHNGDEVRRHLRSTVDELLHPDQAATLLLWPTFVAETCWLIEERRWAAAAYDALRPWSHRHVTVEVANCSFGASDRYLGQLATLLGRFDEAEEHFNAAHDFHRRLGAPGWLAHGRVDHARMLLKRGWPGDPAQAHELVALARETYRRLGMTVHDERAAALTGGLPRGVAPGDQTGRFRLEGEYWAVDYGGTQARLRDSKGLRYLARLLRNPGQEVHALDLVVGESGGSDVSPRAARASGLETAAGDAGSMLDAQAKAAYKRRVIELQQEIEEASAYHDTGRLDRAQQEMDFLVAELSHAVGLGGRDRKAASDAERARQSVTRAIKGAIDRIAKAHPILGEHLWTTVRTGVYSSYVPDPRAPIRWES